MLAFFFFLMIRRPPRSTLDRSSAASDVYKRQVFLHCLENIPYFKLGNYKFNRVNKLQTLTLAENAVSYTHLRAHETVLDLVCRLLLEKKTI